MGVETRGNGYAHSVNSTGISDYLDWGCEEKKRQGIFSFSKQTVFITFRSLPMEGLTTYSDCAYIII